MTLDCEGDMLGSTSTFKCAGVWSSSFKQLFEAAGPHLNFNHQTLQNGPLGPALTAVKPQYTTVFDS